jgi:hypothetical protein
MMNSDEVEDNRKSTRYYRITLIGLIVMAVFVPERYSILIVLGAIWSMLWEISDRLRAELYLHKKTADEIAKLVNKS